MNCDVCVIGGAGHVGLPLSVAFAAKGKRILIYDTNERALATIDSGHMPFMEASCEGMLQSTIQKTLFTSGDPESISGAKFVVVIVGTPVDEHLNPMHEQLWRFFDEITPHLRNGQIVILRSTVYPGTTSSIRRRLKKKLPGIEVCFACERILEGKAMEELYKLPQIIAGEDTKAVADVAELFQSGEPPALPGRQ